MKRRAFLQTAGVGSTLALAASTHAADGDGSSNGNSQGQTVFEFLGRSDQDGPQVTHYGYVTHVFGLEDELLFSDPNLRTEATARLTFLAVNVLDSRHVHGNIITTSAPGEMTAFFNQHPQADFNAPDSFARGRAIASFATRYHNVLNVQAPDQGIANAVAELTQLKATSFELGPQRVRFGRPKMRIRLVATGQGTRTQADPLHALFLLAGSAFVVEA